MKKLVLRALFFVIPFLYSIYASAQPGKGRDCSTTCFSTEVVSAEKTSTTCTSYELKVSYTGDCVHELSHFTVEVPCGKVDNLWNSGNWAQEIGTDPTSGLQGFKIDDIQGFGKGALKYFVVRFMLCTDNDACANTMKCWQPKVAYKAGTCVNYETVPFGCHDPLKATLEKKDATCYDANDGALSLVIEGGQAPYVIQWSNNSSADSIANLSPGNYFVNISDQSGAQVLLEETIEAPEKIALSATSSPATCNTQSDGAIDLTVSGGSGAFTYSWSNGAETEDLQNLAPGAYRVIVTDENNCSATASFNVADGFDLTISSTYVNPDCNASNGSVDITVAGGSAPYSYAWSNGMTTEDLQAIGSGLFTVVVSDQNGCTKTAAVLVRDRNTLSVGGHVESANCNDDASGSIDITVSGGTEPYHYQWSNGATTEDISGLSAGIYKVTVTDANSCTTESRFVVVKKTFQVPREIIQPTCPGEANGSIVLQEPVGGTAPFTYEWSIPGDASNTRTNLGPGTYSVTVTDATGCAQVVTAVISDPEEIVASATIAKVDCSDVGSNSVDLKVSGGTAPYTYEWSDGNTNGSRTGLSAGVYTVTITDSNGCSVSKEITIEDGGANWSCIINEISAPACGSENNLLSTAVTDADSYLWQVESTDTTWSLSGTNTPSVLFTAGSANSTATFTLTIVKDGCTKTCVYTVSACSGNGDGGEDDGEDGVPGDPDGNSGSEDCGTCFQSQVRLIGVSGDCRTYEMEVSTNGLCRHDLSHWTLAIPCGNISNYSNSRGWKMELGKDPTTGLYGLKVDDISGFGKSVDSFTVRVTVCEADDCSMERWDPVVAYKAGQCVEKETVALQEGAAAVEAVSVYPNPFSETVRFEWTAAQPDVQLQIIDQYGTTISTIGSPTGKDDAYHITIESSALPKGIYYYRLIVGKKTWHGKISKR